jgi:diguanylate cyclase (GGDEF)-like protein
MSTRPWEAGAQCRGGGCREVQRGNALKSWIKAAGWRRHRPDSRGNAYMAQRRLGFPLLRFTPELEREYRQSMFQSSRLRTRVLSVLAAGSVVAFDLIDHVFGRSLMIAPALWLLNLVGIPVIFVAYLTTLRSRSTPRVRAAMIGSFLGYGMILSYAILESRTVNPAMPYESLLLLTFADYLLSGLGLYEALGTGLALLACHIAIGWLLRLHAPALPYEIFYLALANVLGLIGLYALDYQARMSFLTANELRLLSMRDGFTGLLNRRSFRRHLHRVWTQARREGARLGLLRLDVDHFKRLNDEYGHAMGDRVLRVLADSLAVLPRRPLDAVGRVGGDEFEGVWYAPDQAWFLELGETLRGRLRSDLERAGIDAGLVTLSGGARLVQPGQDDTMVELLRQIDDTLHQVKREGRNRIVSSGVT